MRDACGGALQRVRREEGGVVDHDAEFRWQIEEAAPRGVRGVRVLRFDADGFAWEGLRGVIRFERESCALMFTILSWRGLSYGMSRSFEIRRMKI